MRVGGDADGREQTGGGVEYCTDVHVFVGVDSDDNIA